MLGKPEITETAIKCEECGQWYKKITSRHLKAKHELTIAEYKEIWGLCKTQPLEALYIKKIRQDCVKIYRHADRLKPYSKINAFKKGHCNNFERRAQHTFNSQENGKLATQANKTTAKKKKASIASKKLWKNKEYREHVISGLIKTHNTPEMRKTMSEKSKIGWNNPKIREQVQKSQKKFWNSKKGKLLIKKRNQN